MTTTVSDQMLEEKIDQWRSYLRRRQAIQTVDVAELEDHLREQVAVLMEAGLDADEAFLVAVKRIGDLDALSREYAIEHSERLWKQLVVPAEGAESRTHARKEAVVAIALAIAAALAVKLPSLFGLEIGADRTFYLRNASLLVLPFLVGYFAWKRGLAAGTLRWMIAAFAVAAVLANIYPSVAPHHTEALTALHLPIALWLAVGIAYAGERWHAVAGRMDFIRFSGELFIYYVLIALGGGVLTMFMVLIFQAIGVDVEQFFGDWLLPTGAAGAVIIASWLVEAKQSVIENMAPVLTRLFTPLFAALLLAFLGAMLMTGRGVGVDRDTLIAFDLLLVVVLGLLLYSLSARDPQAPPDAWDVLQVVLVIAALLANGAALWAIAARISEFGFSPNKVAALGENVILLVNLAWSAVLYLRFLRGRVPFAALERWQTGYLPVYAAWAAVVVIVFPPLFGYA
ncbi:MAG: permease prefix domain 1-containing protein [Anaerolineae bacterium]